ncbi:MAG TPA: phenylalanine--tRNA ligase beta subunit-related protein [Ktedonobacteraceae bacterium]|nr:phenylalanine--tRNA ligase beta subunit-related protein [Ktedonobacteraceae bacterium]
MQLQLEESLKTRIQGVTFGMVTINGVSVGEHDKHLWQHIEALCQRQASEFTLDRLAEYEQIAAVRGLQKSFGFDPTRYRPSSEALLRRVLKGQGLYQINTAVDVNNLCSLEFLLPMCIYDLRNVKGQIRVRIGEPGEEYPGIGRQVFQAANKVIIADDAGIMGSTVSDSERTKVTTTTTDILMAIYAPARQDPQTIRAYAALAGQRMVEFNGGHASDVLALTV